MDNIAVLIAVTFILSVGAGLTGPISSLCVESLSANKLLIGLVSTAAHRRHRVECGLLHHRPGVSGRPAGNAGGRGRRMGVCRGMGCLGFALMAFVAGSIVDRTSLSVPFALAGALSALAFSLSLLIREAPFTTRAGGKGIVWSATVMSRLWPLAAFSGFPLIIQAGWLSDRVGRLLELSSALLCWMVVFLGYALIPIYPWIPLIQLARGFPLAASWRHP